MNSCNPPAQFNVKQGKMVQTGTHLFGLTLVPDSEIVASQIDCQSEKLFWDGPNLK